MVINVDCPLCGGCNCHMVNATFSAATALPPFPPGEQPPGIGLRRINGGQLDFECEEGHSFAWTFEDHSGGAHVISR